MFADLGGVRLHYEDTGEGELIVLIGGFGTNARYWSGVVDDLSGYRVVTFDNRGVGETEYSGPFTLDDMADDVIGLMDHLGIDGAHILGWSMGTLIGQSLALRHRGRVKSLTLVSAFQRSPARAEYVLGTFTAMAAEGVAPVECLAVAVNAFCFPESCFRELMDRGETMQIPRKLEDPRGLADQIAAVRATDTEGRASLIEVPTLVIHGDKDIMVEPQDGRDVADAIAGSRLILLDGIGHSVPFGLYRGAFLSHIEDNR